MKRLSMILLAGILVCFCLPVHAAAVSYADVPAESWAASYIETARELGLMNGKGNGRFGYGETVNRAEMARMLCNLMGWELVNPTNPTYLDVLPGSWYYQAVETASAHGVYDEADSFEPLGAISRNEMAKAYIRALGLDAAAILEEKRTSAFLDCTEQHGYANVAKSIGLMEGKGEGRFAPAAPVKREEAAALLVRFYQSYYAETEFLHGFYAISSYSQRTLAAQMDAVTYMWSTMQLDGSLDTAVGDYRIPDGYDSIVAYLNGASVKQHLGVYMDASGGVETLLLNAESRSKAVSAILAELTKAYELTGSNPYSGVTIDFEGLRGQTVRTAYNAFLTELSQALAQRKLTLYVAVQPALYDGTYFDGFDYRTIGTLADKVILMAHDYHPVSLEGYQGTEWHRNAALTPIDQVYYALLAVTDADTGVLDREKLVLAVSFNAVGWRIDESGKLLDDEPVSVSLSRLAQVLPSAETGYSDVYRNPYLIYETDDGERIFLWYENSQSIGEKMALAKCFGVRGVSVWRLGNIPDYSSYDVADAFGLA